MSSKKELANIAKAGGEKYFIANCKTHGQGVKHLVCDCKCTLCKSKRTKRYYSENRCKVLESNKRWHEKNPNYNKQYYQENQERILKRKKEYSEKELPPGTKGV